MRSAMKQMTLNPPDSNVTPILFPWFALQGEKAVVGSDQGSGNSIISRVFILPVRPARSAPDFEDTRRDSDNRFQGWTHRGRRIRNSVNTEAGRRRSATSAL